MKITSFEDKINCHYTGRLHHRSSLYTDYFIILEHLGLFRVLRQINIQGQKMRRHLALKSCEPSAHTVGHPTIYCIKLYGKSILLLGIQVQMHYP